MIKYDKKAGGISMKQKLSSLYNLETEYPELAAQWDYVRNGSLTPRDVLPGSKKSVFWICDFDPSHVWQSRISNRAYLQRGCPICTRHFHVSRLAMALYYYLRKHGVLCKLEVQVWRYRVDIVIDRSASEQLPVALEIDGYYSHRFQGSAQRDARKDSYLTQHGYEIIRVKELPGLDGISQQGNIISYPLDKAGIWTDRVIAFLLLRFTGENCYVDHRLEYWKIQRVYLHERRQRSLAVRHPMIAEEWSPRNPERPDAVSVGTNGKNGGVAVCADGSTKPRLHTGFKSRVDVLIVPEKL